jgi:hypothetical protein
VSAPSQFETLAVRRTKVSEVSLSIEAVATEQPRLRVLVHRRVEQPGHPFGVGRRHNGSASGRRRRQPGRV